jgi:type III pantothenate kinase
VIGKNTIEALQSGAVYGFTAQVDGVCARMKGELGPATVIATGGLASLITPLSTEIDHHEPWITLEGLRIIWERNQ